MWLSEVSNKKSCCPQQVVFRKPADYSKVAVYKVNWWITVKWQFTSVNQWITVKWWFTSLQVAVYKCKLVVYTCKILNSRFTTVLITLLDTVEVTPFFQIYFCKAVVYMCKPVVYRCQLLLYYKPPLYKL